MKAMVVVRSRHYILSGACGGLAGFLLMEVAAIFYPIAGGTRVEGLVHMAIYFAGFGLAVGAALGMTEGLVAKERWRLWYGLVIGLLLGAAGGFAGGLVGQAIYGLVPLRYANQSNADVVIALDSSGSMRRRFFFGNDPWGRRRKAARRLIDRLSVSDRVAIVDFDDDAEVLLPLTSLSNADVRERARQAVGAVDDNGGTSLDAGLAASLSVLASARGDGRDKHVIFLTDGRGLYTANAFPPESKQGIAIHTIGLGQGVDAGLLATIAETTGGSYYPVADASDLIAVFDRIFSQHIEMTETAEGAAERELLTPVWVLLVLRILSWGAMGLAIGAGQGIRENTREDVRACALGGLLGGAIGGALFDPVSELTGLGAGLVGRALADIVVGAMIGGSMRLAQEKIVEASDKPTTTLLSVLPEKRGIVVAEPGPNPIPAPEPQPLPVPEPPPAPRTPEPAPLADFQHRYTDPILAMARAYASGDYSLRQIAEHFGVPASSVKRAVDQHRGV